MFSHNVQSVSSLQPKSLHPQPRALITRIHSISLLPFRPSSTTQKSNVIHSDTRTPRTRFRSKFIPSSREPEISPPKSAKFRWVKGELIGKGSYAKVYLGLNATTGEIMAVKQVELPQTPSDLQSSRHHEITEALRFEGKTLKGLDHPNIVQYLGYDESPQYLSIFLEYVPGGTISSCLQKHGRFSEEVTKSFTHQMLRGLEYLHCMDIIHRDLKSDNILVEPTGVCKISDFGISKQAEGRAYTGMRGTIYWMAPEILDHDKQGYDHKVDIWSVGCVVLEMWTGERPWFGEEMFPVMLKLSQQRLAPPVPPDLILSEDASDLRRQCFKTDPHDRPSAAELQDHPYLVLPVGWKFDFSEIEETPLRRNLSRMSRRSGKSHKTPRRPQTLLRIDSHITPHVTPVQTTVDAPTYQPVSARGFDSLPSRGVRKHRKQSPPRPAVDDGPPVVYIMPRGSPSSRRAPSPNNSSRTSLDTSGSVSTTRKGFRIVNPDPEPEVDKQPFVYLPPPLPALNSNSPYSAHLAPPAIQAIGESYPPHFLSGELPISSESSSTSNLFSGRASSHRPIPHLGDKTLSSSSAYSESDSEDDDDLWAKRPMNLNPRNAAPRGRERSVSRNRMPSRPSSRLSVHDEWTRPATAQVYENLQEFFPRFDLDKSVSDADLSRTKQGDDKTRRKTKSIRMVAEERNSRALQRRTKLWDSKVEELRMS